MALTLGEMIERAEEKLGRVLTGDEIVLVGRMVDAEKDEQDIMDMLDVEVPAKAPEDDELDTYRYEASGQGVVEIPDVAEK